jgi:hypothetical protein
MKTIILITILLLTSLSAVAQTKVTIIADAPRTDVMEFEKPNKKKAIKRLKSLVRKSQWLKGAWQKPRAKTIFKRKDELSGAVEYYKPSNFTVIYDDVTNKRATEEKEASDNKKEIKRLKSRINDLEIGEDHKRLLKKLAKECLK